MAFLNQNVNFFTEKAWFHLSGYSNAQKYMYWSSINLRQTFEVHIHDQKIGVQHAIIATRIIRPVCFEQTVNSEQYVNDILWPCFESITEEERHGYFMQKVLQHTLLIIPLFILTRCLKTD
jgi:hypothetical protein